MSSELLEQIIRDEFDTEWSVTVAQLAKRHNVSIEFVKRALMRLVLKMVSHSFACDTRCGSGSLGVHSK